MPSSSSVHEQLTDIVVRVLGCPADSVVPQATLAELGADSLTTVEIGEELGRRYGVRLSDQAIDSMRTVQDALDAVAEATAAGSAHQVLHAPPPPPARDEDERRSRLSGFALTFIFFGVVIGGVLGLGGAALVSATGISKVDLPPISGATTPEPTPTPTETPTPEQTTPTDTAEPTITTSSEQVSPGERFLLSGAFPGSPAGEDLQVEVREPGQAWDDFPIQTKTRDGGIFRTELYTSRTGTREFRVTNQSTGTSSPSIEITIG